MFGEIAMENKDKIIRVRMDSSTRHKLYLIKQDKTMSEYIRDNIVKKFVVLVDSWKDKDEVPEDNTMCYITSPDYDLYLGRFIKTDGLLSPGTFINQDTGNLIDWEDDVMKWTYLKYPPLPE